MKKFTVLFFFLVLLVMGCDKTTTQVNPDGTVKPNAVQDHWTDVSLDHKKDVQLTQTSNLETRKALRLKVDHLRQSIPKLLGGIQWTRYNQRSKTEEDMLDVLARTLGEADYLEMTSSITDPTPLFMKFMDDMSAQVCQKAIQQDLGQADENKRVFVRYSEDTEKTLRWVRLKFHGLFVAETSSSEISQMKELYEAVVKKTGSKSSAWQMVCMATLTAPEFLAY